MKSIFRTLREHWAKYLIEALVITFSIIGAFVLDNWKEKRQDRKEEQVILNGLKKEFQENLHEVSRNISLNESVISSVYDMIELIRGKDWYKDPNRVDSLVSRVYSFGTFDAQTGFTDELISAGKLSLLRDEKLKKQLTGWSGVLRNAQEDYEIRLQFYNFNLIPALLQYFTLANGDKYLDFSYWSDSYRAQVRGESPFNNRLYAMNLQEFENILWMYKVNNDFVNLNELNMKDYIQQTIILIEANIN